LPLLLSVFFSTSVNICRANTLSASMHAYFLFYKTDGDGERGHAKMEIERERERERERKKERKKERNKQTNKETKAGSHGGL